jgi:putative transposase
LLSLVPQLKQRDSQLINLCGPAKAVPFRSSPINASLNRRPFPEINYALRMAHPQRTANTGTFFITAITNNRRRIFQTATNAQLFVETLQHYRSEGFYKLFAFVVMPDHVHLLVTTEDLTTAMQRIKGGFSHKLASKLPVWQRGFTDHIVLNRNHFDTRRDYIHQNPVRARLCQHPADYPHSSAYHQPVPQSPS